MSWVIKKPSPLKRSILDLKATGEEIRDMVVELYEAIQREIVPVLIELRRESNLQNGDLVFHEDDEDYNVQLTDRRIVCSNIIAIAVTLPAAADSKGQSFTVYPTDGDVAVTAQAGETIDGAASVALNTAYVGMEFFSDGTKYLSA